LLALRCEAAALVVSQLDTASPQLLPKGADRTLPPSANFGRG